MTFANLEPLALIAIEAGELINRLRYGKVDVRYKRAREPVTNADRAANALICRRLAAEFPGVPIVSEESDPQSYVGFRTAERVFFVDPLDGTHEYIQGASEFVVMLALVEQSEPVASAIVAPASGRCWIAKVGEGAFRLEGSRTRVPIRVSAVRDLTQARIVASRSHATEGLSRMIDAIGSQRVVRCGSAGLKGAAIAEGTADVYPAPVGAGKLWDVCALHALVAAAGGRVSDAKGHTLDYRASQLTNYCGFIATNGLLHDAILERVEQQAFV